MIPARRAAGTALLTLVLSGCGGGAVGDSSSTGGHAGGATGGQSGGGGTLTGGRSGLAGITGSSGGGGSGGAAGSPVTSSGGLSGAAGQGGTGGRMSSGSGGVSGAAGKTGAAGGTGQAGAPGGAIAVFPPPDGNGVCADPQLRITFAAPPTIGASGKIRVYTSAGAVAASVDVAAATTTSVNGGVTFTIQRPIYVDGNAAVVYLPSKPLAYGQSYYVNVDSGAIKSPGGGTFAVTGATAWRFTTAAAGPSNGSAVGVALNGSAPFCSLQGALDFVPSNNSAPVTISLADGVYHEIVTFKSKANVTIHGASRDGTIVEGVNNDNLNTGTKARALIGADGANGLTISNLTIHNLTPQGGSQAEALRLESCDKCVVTGATIISLQDTLLWSGRLYAKDCLIEGNVDYVWGTGAAYFDACEIRTIGRSGVIIVQARNPAATYGYVFVDSKITSDAGLTGTALGRIDVSAYPASHVAYVNCQMSGGIAPSGWTITGGSDTSMLRFWEYQSVDAAGQPIGTSQRAAGSKQLSAAQAAMMRDPTVVLAGWLPPGS